VGSQTSGGRGGAWLPWPSLELTAPVSVE